MKIVSFNLRCVWDGDGINGFMHRAGMVLDKIHTEKPDIIGFQEGVEKTISFLRQGLSDYTIVFNQRDADFGGEGLAIAFRTEAWELLGLNFFWLSETPYVPASRYPGQSPCPRIAQCAILKEKASGKLLRLSNNHLDYESDEVAGRGIGQVLDFMKEEQKKLSLPLFLLGDFNRKPDSQTVRLCKTDAQLPLCDLTSQLETTFHQFGKLTEPCKIDYIFSDAVTAQHPHTVTLWKEEHDGIFLSDHYPVCLSIEL